MAVRQCPGCQYLVPPAWERCKRCDADLASARPRELVGAGAARPHAHAPASPVPPATANRRAEVACSRPALPFDPSSPLDVRASYERVPTVGEAWAPAAPPVRAKRLPIVGLLLAALIGGSVWFAWRQATARSVPEGLQGYVHDGDGVAYSSPIGGFTVTLPVAPQEVTESFVLSGASVGVSAAVSVVDEHGLGVLWFDAPPALIAAPDIDLALQQLAESYAASDNQIVSELDYVQANGYPALDATVESGAISGKVRVVLAGQRVYVLVAGGIDDGAAGFETLVESFTLEPLTGV
jgi:hypothetical protein